MSARGRAVRLALPLGGLLLCAMPRPAAAQPIDMSHGGPIEITARDGIEWHQADQQVVAIGDARAVRGNVTVIADRLIAHYRKKADPAGAAPPTATAVAAKPTAPTTGLTGDAADTGNNEIYRLEAIGRVHIYTTTDQAICDHAVYDIDQAVLVMTGHDLKVTTPQDVITARDSMEYWSQKHMAVARGDALAITSDGRRLSGDTLVAYTTDPNVPPAAGQAAAAKPAAPARPAATSQDPLEASGKLQRVEVFGNVEIRTATQTARGDRGVYVPDTGIARLIGNARLTQGENQVEGAALEVNLQTGIYRLLSDPGARVHGLVVPNDAGGSGSATPQPDAPGAGTAKPAAGAPR